MLPASAPKAHVGLRLQREGHLDRFVPLACPILDPRLTVPVLPHAGVVDRLAERGEHLPLRYPHGPAVQAHAEVGSDLAFDDAGAHSEFLVVCAGVVRHSTPLACHRSMVR